MRSPPAWREDYEGGAAGREHVLFAAMARDLLRAWRAAAGVADGARLVYAKTDVAIAEAWLRVDRHLPAALAVGHFQAGACYRAVLRFSNASSTLQPDSAPDMRGLAIRLLAADDGFAHDLLFTNFPTALARDARQFFEIVMAQIRDRRTLLAQLAERLGEPESRRIAEGLKASLRVSPSLALEHYWTGCAFLWGDAPARLELRPTARAAEAFVMGGHGLNGLHAEFAERLAQGDVSFRLAVQPYIDADHTPIEDSAVDWGRAISPPREIATLEIPAQMLTGAVAAAASRRIDGLAFHPWNAPAAFRPLGSLNRFRRWTYPRLTANRADV